MGRDVRQKNGIEREGERCRWGKEGEKEGGDSQCAATEAFVRITIVRCPSVRILNQRRFLAVWLALPRLFSRFYERELFIVNFIFLVRVVKCGDAIPRL